MESLKLAIDLAFIGDAVSDKYTLIEFGIAAAFYGLLIVLLDFCTTKAANKTSSLKLTYSGYGAIIVVALWGVGAGLAGLLGAGAGIFEVSRTACIFVGAGWPVVLPRLLASATNELSTEKVSTKG
ncbi:TPA: hypothetical protein ACPJ06_003296 [Vibrio diabolicus]|uniref:hypothetical protein n=1 Tax=unclassified Vibrio TaxID=2614977 RepID=UPI00188277A7|nr:hypothetical protein [Vibrio sp. OPT46]EJS0370837.1 hypothetical protein [Vibrio alginolyticus]MBE8570468.1 hypothetical protein [Vibrio sp. OPT46]